MKKILDCRRTSTAWLAIGCLTLIGIVVKDATVSMAISGVAIGLGAANAYEKKGKNEPS